MSSCTRGWVIKNYNGPKSTLLGNEKSITLVQLGWDFKSQIWATYLPMALSFWPNFMMIRLRDNDIELIFILWSVLMVPCPHKCATKNHAMPLALWLQKKVKEIFQMRYCMLFEIKRLQKYQRPKLEVKKNCQLGEIRICYTQARVGLNE